MLPRSSLRVVLAAVVAFIVPLVFLAPNAQATELDPAAIETETTQGSPSPEPAVTDQAPDSDVPGDEQSPTSTDRPAAKSAAAASSESNADPSVSVSASEFSADGSHTVTVTGTGFDPALATGSRPPLMGKPGGTYVVFGKFAQAWKPSTGAPGASRVNSSQKWAVSAGDMASIGGANAGAVELRADGSFTAELTVDKSAIDAKATAADLVNYGVYTYPGSGAVQAKYETYTPITFTEPAPADPSVNVSKTEFSSDGSATVTVTGTGFDPALATGARPPLAGKPAGAYVVVGKFAQQWKPSQGGTSAGRAVDAQKWAVSAGDMATIGGANAGAIELRADGSFTAELTVDKSAIDAEVAKKADPSAIVNYGIYTYPGSGAVQAKYETYTPITFTEPAPADPSVSVSDSEFSADGSHTVTVTGTGFDPALATGSRPPLAGKPGGAYVVFGKFAPTWKPSAGAPGASRVNSSQQWAVSAGDMASIGGANAGAIELRPDGSFTAELTVDKSAIDGKATAADLVNYGIYTYPGSGAVQAKYETYTPITFTGPEPVVTPELTATVTEQVKGSLKLSVSGSKYAKQWPGVYVALAPAGGANTSDPSAAVAANYVSDQAMDAFGGFTAQLALDAEAIAKLDSTQSYSVYTFRAHGQPDLTPSQSVERPVTLNIALLQGGGTTDPGTKPDTKTKGSLHWGVKAHFRNYITGPIAEGSIGVSNGASASGGTFRFFQKSTSADANGIGSTRYGGTVSFSGHHGALNFKITDPVITVESGSRGTLTAVAGGSRVTVATLNISRANKSTSDGAVKYSGTPATLTAAGARAFQGFYKAGESMDPVTFTIGADGGAASGSQTVATAEKDDEFKPPANPPATTGAELYDAPEGGLKAGDIVSASAGGFAPNETGVAVVVYSEPVVLAQDVKADAQGNVEWSGPLPGDLEAGEHTLTFQGESISRGVKFTIAGEDAVGQCTVKDAELKWGVKEAWRAYISGSIAEGDWKTSGNASYATPTFTFSDGEGELSAQNAGNVGFEGAIEFEGHHGALKVALANPLVRLVDEDRATLMVDVTAGDRNAAMAGDESTKTTKAVPFAEVDLTKAKVQRSDDGTLTITGAPTVLTEQGHQVFDTYEAGDSLDPINLTVSTDADCAAAAETSATPVSDKQSADDDESTPWWWIAGAAVLAAITFGGGLWLGRRRATP